MGGGFLGLFQSAQVAGQIRHPEHRQTGLAGAEEIAGATERQIFFGDLKAVVGFAEGLDPLQGVGIFVVGSENAETLGFAAANTATELMQLA